MKQKVERIIELLRWIKARPGWLGEGSILRSFELYQMGLDSGLRIFDAHVSASILRDVHSKNNLEVNPQGPVPQLRDQGLSDEQIFEALVQLEIEKYEMVLEQLVDSDQPLNTTA